MDASAWSRRARANKALAFVENGLVDFSVSRSADRVADALELFDHRAATRVVPEVVAAWGG